MLVGLAGRVASRICARKTVRGVLANMPVAPKDENRPDATRAAMPNLEACFVCLDDVCTFKSGCACGAPVHPKCLLRAVEKVGTVCTICKSDIANVSSTTIHVLNPTSLAAIHLLFLSGGTILLCFSAWFFAEGFLRESIAPFLLPISSIFAFLGICALWAARHLRIVYPRESALIVPDTHYTIRSTSAALV